MFNSEFSRRFFRWARSPKKYTVIVSVLINGGYTELPLTVVARSKAEAKDTAIDKARQQIKLKVDAVRSHGRINNL